jgi:dihydropyrimidine dehydrogenase (NAD+) subunit PreT
MSSSPGAGSVVTVVELVVVLVLVGVIVGAATFILRRREAREEKGQEQLRLALAEGQTVPLSLHPVIDPTLCVGSFSCINSCPEGEIIGVVNGVAQLVEAAHCIGHARCAVECPVGAIKLVFGSAERGVDLPEVDEGFETNRRGVFIIGELGGMGLIRNALRQGLYLGDILKKRLASSAAAPDLTDVVVVGAGPAGIAAAAACKKHGLSVRIFEQDTVGGAIAHYPRGKVVMTEKIVMPNYGAFGRSILSKEELLGEMKTLIERNGLVVEQGHKVVRIEGSEPSFVVTTHQGTQVRCKTIALAVGLRGTPRTLGVAGEDLPKVVYRLVDPEQYHGRSVLVVGGGDSAVEAACQLAEESTARVAISYRQAAFTKCKPKNRERIERLVHDGHIRAFMSTRVTMVEPHAVHLAPVGADDDERAFSEPSIAASKRARVLDELPTNPTLRRARAAMGAAGSSAAEQRLPNDDVIVCAGGELPVTFLRSIGVQTRRYLGEERHASTDGGPRQLTKAEAEERSRLRLTAILVACGAAIIAGLAFIGREYYWLPIEERVQSPLHEFLRPAGIWGHGVGLVSTTFMLANFLYAVRKRWRFMKGKASIRTWLSFHMFVGIMSPLVIAFHAAFLVNNQLAIATWAALAVVVGTGIFGRYLFSIFPAQAGRLLAVADVREQMATAERLMRKEIQRTKNVKEVTRILDRTQAAPLEKNMLEALRKRADTNARIDRSLEEARAYFNDAEAFERFKESAAKVEWARRQSAFYASMTRVFRLWLVVHVVLAVFMVGLIGLHVAVVAHLGMGLFGGGA